MDHTTDEQLQSFLDREASDTERVGVLRHVAACASCRDRLEALDAIMTDVSSAVALLRPPAGTRPTFAALEARALAADSARFAAGGVTAALASAAPMTASATPTGRRSSTVIARSWLRAAAVVLALAGVASAAVVIQRRAADRADVSAAANAEQEARPVPAEPQAARSGVSVLADAGRIVIAVRGAAAGTMIDVGVEASSAASAFVRGDGEGIRFSAQNGRIDVDATGRAITLDVRLPATATAATVEVDGQVRARKVDGRVRVERGGSEVRVRARGQD